MNRETLFPGVLFTIRLARRGLSLRLLALFVLLALGPAALAWGPAHKAITNAALETLPAWQKALLGKELALMGESHCVIPDQVNARPEIRKYAMMESRPGQVYLTVLHLPGTQEENFEVLRYFLRQAVTELRKGDVAAGARYSGTVAHFLEDWGCPAHSVPGDNMFTLFKQFLPPPADLKDVPLHGPIEKGVFPVSIGHYQPRLMGATVDEAAFNLLLHSQESTVQARAQVIPIMQALYVRDDKTADAAQQKAAVYDAAIIADALYTIFCLAENKIEPKALEPLRTMDLSARFPLEAANLAMSQNSFFSKPYWGHATAGASLRDGTEAVPLRLVVENQGTKQTQTFKAGVGTGTRSVLSYLVPQGIYQRFEVLAGVHAELGLKGRVNFEVLGDGKSLAKVGPLSGGDAARRIRVPLAGITRLQLVATSAGGDGLGNYAIWAEPRLIKE